MYLPKSCGVDSFVYAWDSVVVEGKNKSRVCSKIFALESQLSNELGHFASSVDMMKFRVLQLDSS